MKRTSDMGTYLMFIFMKKNGEQMNLLNKQLLSIPTPLLFNQIGYEDEYLFQEILIAFISNQLCKNSLNLNSTVSLKLNKNGFDIEIMTIKKLSFKAIASGVFWIPTKGLGVFQKAKISEKQLNILVALISVFWDDLSDAFIKSDEIGVNSFNLPELIDSAGLSDSFPVYNREFELVANEQL